MKCPYCGRELISGDLYGSRCLFLPYNPDKKARFASSDNGEFDVVPAGFSRHINSHYCDQCHILITPNVGPREWKRRQKKKD